MSLKVRKQVTLLQESPKQQVSKTPKTQKSGLNTLSESRSRAIMCTCRVRNIFVFRLKMLTHDFIYHFKDSLLKSLI